jgi:UrcA family protein
MRTLITASLISLAAIGAASAQETRTTEVPYSAEALASEHGRQALMQDIRRAARDVCDIAGAFDAEVRRAERECAADAVARATAQLETRIAALEPEDGAIVIRLG